MILEEALKQFLNQPRRASTELTYRKVLTRHIKFLGPERDVMSIMSEDIDAWGRSLMHQDIRYANHKRRPQERGKLSEHTVYKHLKITRVFWKWLVTRGAIPMSPMQGMKIPRPPKPAVTRRAAPLSTLAALIRVMRNDARDWAMFCFLVETGVRAGSLCELTLSMLDLDNCEAYLPQKGNREHVAVFTEVTAAAMAAYLEIRPKARHSEVFLNQDGNPWSSDSLRSWLRRRCQRAGVRPISPHALRRAVGCHLSLMQVPLSLVQKHLGHSSPVITATHYMPDDTAALHDMLERFGLLRALDVHEEDEPEEDQEA